MPRRQPVSPVHLEAIGEQRRTFIEGSRLPVERRKRPVNAGIRRLWPAAAGPGKLVRSPSSPETGCSMGIRALLTALVALAAAWPAAGVAAEERAVVVGDRAREVLSQSFTVLRNPDAPLTLEQARTIAGEGGFSELDDTSPAPTNFGLTRDEIWLRLPFRTASELPRRWMLEIGHASLDRVDVYLAAAGEPFAHWRSGDRMPFNEKVLPHRNHVFELTLRPDTAYTLYLRIASEGTLTVPVRLWRPDALWRHDQGSYAGLTVYFGLLLGLLAYNLLLYFSLRDRLYLIYVGFIGALAIGQTGLTGFAGQFLWPDNAWLTHISPAGGMSVAGVMGALFAQRFLGDTPARLRVQWLMPAFVAGYGATLVCVVAGPYYFAAIAVNALSLAFAIAALALGAASLYFRQPGARFFVLAWAVLLTGVIVLALHNLGALPSNVVTSNALLIGSGSEMLLLSFALADRIDGLQRARDEAQQEALEMRQRMVEQLQESERQLEQRVSERTRELEEANRKLEHQAGHDGLTGLVNREGLRQRAQRALARADRQKSGAALIVIDLDGFKPVNDRFGHTTGDRVLVNIARRLTANLRENDTVARVGGDEFVVLAEGVASRRDAEVVRDKLRADVVEPMEVAPGETVRISASFGFALYPDDAGDPESLFTEADRAMYEDKAARRS